MFNRLDALFASSATAPLLADSELSDNSQALAISSDRTIRHDSLTESVFLTGEKLNSVQQISLIEDCTTGICSERATNQGGFSEVSSNTTGTEQFGISQISFVEAGTIQKRSVQSGISKVCFTTITSDQSATSQVSATQISSTQKSTSEIGTLKTGFLEDTVFQISSDQIATAQISIGKVSTSQISFNQISFIQNNTPEVSLSSGIALQQFLSSHHFNLQNTTVGTWSSLLQGQTPFNLNIEIKVAPL